MKASTLIHVLCAAHYTSFVESPWPERGGLMLVAPPGQLKTTMLFLLRDYYGVYLTSDLNTQTLGHLKDDIIGERIRTLVIPDMQKLYERHPMVSSNLEGTLRAMLEEGFVATSFQDASAISTRARALLLTAATPSFYEGRLQHWRQSGFSRRMIFSVFSLSNPNMLLTAVEEWERVEIQNGLRFSLPSDPIPHTVHAEESKIIKGFLSRQPDITPFVLLKKIACVLRWRFRKLKVRDETMEILEDFSESLKGEGAKVKL